MLSRPFLVRVSWAHTEERSLGTSGPLIPLVCLELTDPDSSHANQPFRCQAPQAQGFSSFLPHQCLSPQTQWACWAASSLPGGRGEFLSWSETSGHSPQTVVLSVLALAVLSAPALSVQSPGEGTFSSDIIRAKESFVTGPSTGGSPQVPWQ